MYAWARDLFLHKDFIRELKLTEKRVVDWCNFHRDICTDHFERHPILLGGPGSVVEIDERRFGKRKYNVGRSFSAVGFRRLRRREQSRILSPSQRSVQTEARSPHPTIHPSSIVNCN